LDTEEEEVVPELTDWKVLLLLFDISEPSL